MTLALTLGACGTGDHEIEVGGSAPADAAAAERIRDYLSESYDESEPVDFAALPPDDRARFAGLEDNLAELYESVQRIDVSGGVVTMSTDLEGDDEGLATANLICTTIYASDALIAPKGHTVSGESGVTLATCTRDGSPL